MARRRRNLAEENLDEVSEELGWGNSKKVAVLLRFIEEQDLGSDLGDFLEAYVEQEADEEDDSSEDDE